MIQLKYDEHLLSIKKELLGDKDFSDDVFFTKQGIFHGHFSLILQQIPSLATLVCEACIANHQKIVFFLPEMGPDALSTALLEFYLKGDVDKLESILGVDIIFYNNIYGSCMHLLIDIISFIHNNGLTHE